MKRLLLILVMFFSVVFTAVAQEDVINAFKSGNSKTLAAFFTPSVELNLPGTEGMFSKAQAEGIMRDFFSKNTCKAFSVIHQGTSKDGAKYSIANLQTNAGTYRVYIFLKKDAENFLVKELRVESEK